MELTVILTKWLRLHTKDCKECDFEIEHTEKLIRQWAIDKLPENNARNTRYLETVDDVVIFDAGFKICRAQAKKALEGK